MRKDKLQTNEIYHVLNKSIAGYEIFNNNSHYFRMLELLRFYNRESVEYKYSRYIKLLSQGYDVRIDWTKEYDKLVTIIAYCIMPTHLHLILKQLCDNGITTFMRKISDSYTRYFNIRHDRKGPLWVGRFKNVLVDDDEQLLHLSRYLHLNPSSAGLVLRPEDWQFSSYHEYLGEGNPKIKICQFNKSLDINPKTYKKFVESRRSYQRKLSKIKKIAIE